MTFENSIQVNADALYTVLVIAYRHTNKYLNLNYWTIICYKCWVKHARKILYRKHSFCYVHLHSFFAAQVKWLKKTVAQDTITTENGLKVELIKGDILDEKVSEVR